MGERGNSLQSVGGCVACSTRPRSSHPAHAYSIGSGGPYALAVARALSDLPRDGCGPNRAKGSGCGIKHLCVYTNKDIHADNAGHRGREAELGFAEFPIFRRQLRRAHLRMSPAARSHSARSRTRLRGHRRNGRADFVGTDRIAENARGQQDSARVRLTRELRSVRNASGREPAADAEQKSEE